MFASPGKILLVLCFLLAGGLGPSFSQSFYFRHYQVEQGLSNNAAISCLQDKKGFTWFGTKDGLNRFDGYTFKIFRNNPSDSNSLGSNFVHCLYEDKQGVLWVGTESGLYAYNEKKESFFFSEAICFYPRKFFHTRCENVLDQAFNSIFKKISR